MEQRRRLRYEKMTVVEKYDIKWQRGWNKKIADFVEDEKEHLQTL